MKVIIIVRAILILFTLVICVRIISFMSNTSDNGEPNVLAAITTMVITIFIIFRIAFSYGEEETHSNHIHQENIHSEIPDNPRKKNSYKMKIIGNSNEMNPKILGYQYNKNGELIGFNHAIEGISTVKYNTKKEIVGCVNETIGTRICTGCFGYGNCFFTKDD